MNASADIRTFLRNNPGWHFLSDVCAALGLKGKDRYAAASAVSVMKLRKVVESEGRHGTMKYRLLRECRPKAAIKRVARPSDGE